ncbi:MAG: ankyrin repeat domain-containing protein [Leptospiraceae bacterium]|nr:ankyrin repeat domain-containing protein [Leptospiraceae bacterium]
MSWPRMAGCALWFAVVSLFVLFARPVGLAAQSACKMTAEVANLTSSDNSTELRRWLSEKKDPDYCDARGRSLLWIATWRSQQKNVELLLQWKANVNIEDINGATALHVAAEKGNVPILNLLIKAKADVNRPDARGRTPLSQSIVSQQRSVTIRLLQAGARADTVLHNGWDLLMIAALQGRDDLIADLLKAGAPRDGVNEYAENALEIAIKSAHLKVVQAFLKHGWDVNRVNPMRNKRTPLMLAAESGQAAMVRLLAQGGARLEERDALGCTALFLAVQAGHFEATHALLGLQADPNAMDSGKLRPLQVAMQPENAGTHTSIIKLLKENGAR